ncbi:MAG: DsbA family protein [Acidobacteriota bacterium]|nr:DsbA family protein [Acidobacteriota bacterium]
MIIGLAAMLLVAGARQEIVEGNPASPVRVTIYEDLQCTDCQRLRSLMDEKILPRYGSRVAFVHRDFPLPKHEWARQAAIAGRWIYEQNPAAGIIFRREIMSEQLHITSSTLKPWLAEFAVRHKLDPAAIVAALSDARLVALVDQDYQGGLGRGIAHAPTVLAANQSLVETVVYEDFARLIDAQLQR